MNRAFNTIVITVSLFLLFGQAINVAQAGPRAVFATYMTCCPLKGNQQSVQDYKHEIQQAQKVGIDGFALDISYWPKERRNTTNVDRLFDAADQLQFKLFIMADQGDPNGGLSPEAMHELLMLFSNRPSYYKFEERSFISTYLGTEDWIKKVRSLASADNMKTYFVPFLASRDGSTLPNFVRSPNLAAVVSDLTSIDGYFSFRVVGDTGFQTSVIDTLGATLKRSGKTYMVGVSPYYRRKTPKLTVDDGEGVNKIVAGLRAAQLVGANWVQIVTWNDWEESTYVQPFEADLINSSNERWKGLLNHGPILRFLEPFIRAYKDGVLEPRGPDKAILLYRPSLKINHCDIGSNDLRLRGIRDVYLEGLQDEVYVAVLLAKPAILRLSAGKYSQKFDLAAGFHQVKIPAQVGSVSSQIRRDGKLILESREPLPISRTKMESCFNLYSAEMLPPVN